MNEKMDTNNSHKGFKQTILATKAHIGIKTLKINIYSINECRVFSLRNLLSFIGL